jgi:exodeoxyribonuclease V beta subunit
MTRDAETLLSRASREGRDFDEQGKESPAEAVLAEREGGEVARERVLLADFPRGAGPGEALHAIFENIDFAEGLATAREPVFERELTRRGLSLEHLPACRAAVPAILDTQLFEGFSLGQLRRANKRPELEFSLPVGRENAPLSAQRLAEALGTGPFVPSLAPDYLKQLGALPFRAWSGFLRGFIDLVFEHEGRLYVVDYKSNYLGETYGDYEGQALDVAMRQHHYPLQALLYALAVHRHAQRRVPGYTYETGFGGVYYLFLRGMTPALGASTGVVCLRPSAAEIEQLSAVFEHPEAPVGGRVAAGRQS